MADITYEKVLDDKGQSTGYLRKVVAVAVNNVDHYSLKELKQKKAEIEALINEAEQLGVEEK